MPTLQEFWKPLFNAFDPWGELVTATDLARYYVEREKSPLDQLATDLQLSRQPEKALLVGHIGSGKTSSLARLREHLKDLFFIVPLNAETSLSTFNIGHAEVLVHLGLGVYYEARRQEAPISGDKFNKLVDSLRTLISEQGESGAAAWSSDKVLEKIGVMIKYGFSGALTSKLEVRPVVAEVVNRVNDILAEVEGHTGKPVLVTLDGLDKLDVAVARDVFAHSTLLTRPACHVIYTIPIPLRYDSSFSHAIANFRVCDLPNFKINNRNGTSYPSGRTRLGEVIRKRIADHVSAKNPAFTEEAIAVLVEMSGGLLRDLIRLAQTACREAFIAQTDRVDERLARAAVQALTNEQAANLRTVHWEELQQVYRTKRLTTRIEELNVAGEVKKVVVCDQLLEGRHIFAYVNDETWFDVHPVLTSNLAR